MIRKVYRIEWKDGYGPYDSRTVVGKELCLKHNGRKPMPHDDGIAFDPEHRRKYLCACDSVRSLKRWFWGFWRKLEDAGYVIWEYEVDDAYISFGKSQLIFRRDKSVKTKVVPYNESSFWHYALCRWSSR